jgi:hypothetical protein
VKQAIDENEHLDLLKEFNEVKEGIEKIGRRFTMRKEVATLENLF